MLTPCDDGNCDWILSPDQVDQRWYPTLEALEDGSMIILGGCRNGGYVNDASQDNPTYEFFPPKGALITSPILRRTLPANLFPLTWLLPSGHLLIQSNWETVLLDYKTNIETPLDNIPDAVRTYPASAATMMLPLTPANNWTATILFCGGSNVQRNQWTSPDFIVPTYPASSSCVRITPDVSSSYVQDDPMPQPHSMSNFIALADGRLLNLNGGSLGKFHIQCQLQRFVLTCHFFLNRHSWLWDQLLGDRSFICRLPSFVACYLRPSCCGRSTMVK
jgi:hypothetical protein